MHENFKVICWEAEIYNDQRSFTHIGHISSVKNDGTVVVICGVGKIILKKLRLMIK